MVALDPLQKLNYIQTNWGEELYAQALQHAEMIVCISFVYITLFVLTD